MLFLYMVDLHDAKDVQKITKSLEKLQQYQINKITQSNLNWIFNFLQSLH